MWAAASEDPPLAATRRLPNENIIYPVTSELQEMVCWQFSGSLELGWGGGGDIAVNMKHETKGGLLTLHPYSHPLPSLMCSIRYERFFFEK